MIQHRLDAQESAHVMAHQEQLHPLPARRQDTGELLWIVPSRRDPTRNYLLTREGDGIRCPCPRFHHHGSCAHAEAVQQFLQARQQKPNPKAGAPRRTPPPLPAPKQRVQSRSEEERRQREAALRRERALLWTDDKPFSIWKS